MTFNILAILTDTETVAACLSAATAAALSRDTVIQAFHPRLRPENLITTEELLTERRRAEITAALDHKKDALERAVAAWVAASGQGVTWIESEGRTIDAIVAAHGHDADLVVLAHPAEAEGRAALHSAIFHTGRLLLVAPPTGAKRIGKRVAIAWKMSDQAMRAVVDTVPWLKRADDVWVLTVDADASDVLALLEDHGIAAEHHTLEAGEQSTTECLLANAHALGADCLVMGAFHHFRLVEAVLGGVTHDMLHSADLPLFMMH